MLSLNLREWKQDTVVRAETLGPQSTSKLENMLLHWLRCLPEFNIPPEAVTMTVNVQVDFQCEVPWCQPLVLEQPAADQQTGG